jgi:phage protein D
MANTFRLILNGTDADDAFYTELSSLEVEENADLPGAIQLSLPVDRSDDGEVTYVSDDRLQPFASLAVVVTPDGGDDECIFDGLVLTHKLHLERGSTASTLKVWGQDFTWQMNLEEKVKEWVDVTDSDVANAIFDDYGIAAAPGNADDDSPSHTEDGFTLMQRASDIQFLRTLARRNGKLCRISCAGIPGKRTGIFSRPDLMGDSVLTLDLNDPNGWAVDSLDFEWDVTRPTSVYARQALFTDSDEDGVGASTSDSGLPLLDARSLAAFAGATTTVLLSAPVNDARELTLRAQSVLREAGWFARCEGEADVARLKAILRAGTVVAVAGAGSLNSGKYLVWSVLHTITADSHKMKFTLVRNAVGPPPSSGGAIPGVAEGL